MSLVDQLSEAGFGDNVCFFCFFFIYLFCCIFFGMLCLLIFDFVFSLFPPQSANIKG